MKDSWIDPEGNIIEVGDFMHNEYASELLENEMGFEGFYNYMKENNIRHPFEVLHNRGWVRVKINTSYLPRLEVLGSCINLVEKMDNTIDPELNSKQLDVVLGLCEKFNTQFHVAINDKKFW